ncbi:DEAD/DEAH box helicase, partial [Enterococcus faecalis]|nr:DEAD/DEAH box helicase [Enterococcus faecalis]
KAALPFTLTAGQEEVLGQILSDMAGEHPMQKLLQADVGAGKTVVAGLAMTATVDAGYQAALLAPTEVLAAQHAVSLSRMLPVPVELLTGS